MTVDHREKGTGVGNINNLSLGFITVNVPLKVKKALEMPMTVE
jgi:hypothetical protein